MQNNDSLLGSWKKELASLSDDVLIERTRECAMSERTKTAWLVAHLAEIYRRDLSLRLGFSSIYKYAREELRLTESEAWERGCAARLAIQLPETIGKIARKELTLGAAVELFKALREGALPVAPAPSKVEVLAAALQPGLALEFTAPSSTAVTPVKPTVQEKRELLEQVLGKTQRESAAALQTWKYERAGLKPPAESPRPKSVRRSLPSQPWTELGFFVNPAELSQWDRLRDLISHQLGTRDPQAVWDWMLAQCMEKVDPVRQEARREKREAKKQEAVVESASTHDAPFLGKQETLHQAPESLSEEKRQGSAQERRHVSIRDQGRCQFIARKTGRQCDATAFMDHDHAVLFSQGGKTDEKNLRLMCASHNRRRHRWSPADQPLPMPRL